jgi:hypothetical protein
MPPNSLRCTLVHVVVCCTFCAGVHVRAREFCAGEKYTCIYFVTTVQLCMKTRTTSRKGARTLVMMGVNGVVSFGGRCDVCV